MIKLAMALAPALALLLVACGAHETQATSTPRSFLTADVMLAPSPARVETPALSMRQAMRMVGQGKAVETLVAGEAGPGTYRTQARFGQSTRWTIVVHVRAGELYTTVEKDVDVR